MTSERRVVRPYRGTDQFQAILDRSRLHIGPEIVGPGQRASVSSSSYRNDPVRLVLASEEDVAETNIIARRAAEELGIAPHDIEFVVVATSPGLRLMSVPHRQRLSEEGAIPAHVMMSRETGTDALDAPSGGLDLEVCFALAEALEPRPLTPSRKGTWLGRMAFALRTELGELGFTPQPLTADFREKHGIPSATVRYITVEPDALFDAELADAVEVYVDDELLNHISRANNQPAAIVFQRQLFVDVVAAIITEVSGGSDRLNLAELEGTVLGRLVELVAGRGTTDDQTEALRQTALNQLTSQPALFLARAEARAGLKDDLRRAIQGDPG